MGSHIISINFLWMCYATVYSDNFKSTFRFSLAEISLSDVHSRRLHNSHRSNTGPHHDQAPAKTVMVSNAYRCETLKGHTRYLDSSIREFHAVSGLVSEKYSCPVFQRDNTPVGDVSECDFASTECGLLVVWPHTSCMVTVSDCLHGNPCTSDILRVILQDTSRD